MSTGIDDADKVSELEGEEMPKSTRNTGKAWTPTDVSQLRNLAKHNTPTRVIGLKLGEPRMRLDQRHPTRILPSSPLTNPRMIGGSKLDPTIIEMGRRTRV